MPNTSTRAIEFQQLGNPMKAVDEELKAVVSIWEKINHVEQDKNFPKVNVNEYIANFFNPGAYFYILINFFDLRIEYVHSTIKEILGMEPQEFDSLPKLLEIMHPNDVPQVKLKEEAAGVFFYSRCTPEEIPFYKSTYTTRLGHSGGKYKHFLIQSIALTVTDGRIHHVLSVFTDVTFMNLLPDDRISFIGINGAPSYYSLSTDTKTVLTPQKELELSQREREIVKLLAEGLGSKQIADALYISAHTVDTHRRNLLKKTGTKNTLELTVMCLKKGLI